MCYVILTAMEQEIINKVIAEHAKYKHLTAGSPHEQDNIPNSFDVLTPGETDYLEKHPELLKEIQALW